MKNHALSSSGAKVVMASCNVERLLPSSIIDGRSDTFWMTSGLYPQCFVLAFPTPVNVGTVYMQSHNVKSIVLEGTAEEEPKGFCEIIAQELPANNGGLQKTTLPSACTECKYLKVIITSAHDHLCAVYGIQVLSTS
ncbi:intraflagellar transport protein 25 homolog [Ornithodoros turicata]|uniref:intraflagellar transport protein 25 homolog n=1 Tax=Ornithodoros turicata TaxID=34597 RepID=UPI003139FB11